MRIRYKTYFITKINYKKQFFVHFFVEQNQRLFKDFPGQKLQFSSTLFWALSYIKPCLTFLQVKMPVLSQENDGCPMSVVGNVKTFVAALCFMNIWAISKPGMILWLHSHLFRNLHFPGILNWQWSRSLATDGWSRDVMIFYFHNF